MAVSRGPGSGGVSGDGDRGVSDGDVVVAVVMEIVVVMVLVVWICFSFRLCTGSCLLYQNFALELCDMPHFYQLDPIWSHKG